LLILSKKEEIVMDAVPVLVGLVTVIVLFLILREFWCWYWKLNRMVELLESIDSSLKQLPAVSRARAVP
jgi:hypothetical protein